MSLVRFTDFLLEVVAIDRNKKERFGLLSGKKTSSDSLKDKGYKHLSSDAHHDYYEKHHKRGEELSNFSSNYLAHNKATKRVEMHVDGYKNKAANFHVATLSGAHKATIKAHDFYHHLIKKNHISSLSSDKQSTGGRAVWEKLRKNRSLNVHGYDPKTKKGVNVHSGDEEAYSHEHAKDHDASHHQAKRTVLVAHKK